MIMRIIEDRKGKKGCPQAMLASPKHTCLSIHNSTLNNNEYYMLIYKLQRKPLENPNLIINTKITINTIACYNSNYSKSRHNPSYPK